MPDEALASGSTPNGVRRRAWVAGLLSFFVCGLGQLRCGRAPRALVCFVADLLIQAGSALVLIHVRPFPLNLWIAGHLQVLGRALIVIDAVLLAQRVSGKLRPPWFSRAPLTITILLVWPTVGVTGAALLLRATVAEAFYIPSKSMSDTILPGDRLLSDKLFFREPARGDVVVYWTAPDGTPVRFAHRVIGLPGETVEVRGARAWVNGRGLDEPYVRRDDADIPDFGPAVVPQGHYFLLGDWRSISRDSRAPEIGFVARDRIVARAATIFFSMDERTGRVRWNRIGRVIR